MTQSNISTLKVKLDTAELQTLFKNAAEVIETQTVLITKQKEYIKTLENMVKSYAAGQESSNE